ncbi:RHS repeat-associated core domain-containing protein [Pseudomonas sp. MS646]|uniref:RHS repeat-associated core domain-containing protein n=1 Tax=Pseudomonas sp. MS646 TaxID=3118751 RepID=UPI0030CF660E
MAGSDKVGQPGSNGSLGDSGVSRNETTDGFHYDALDNLIGRTTSAGREQRFYRSDELANETNGNINSTFIRAEGVVLAEHRTGSGSEVMLLAGDDKNSVLSEISQGAVKSIAYSAYGHLTQSASVNCHLGYNGERRDTQTGWYLLGNGYRVFNPRLMRFHSPDNLSPFGKGGLNAYMYCVGDPVNRVDPTGHISKGFFLRIFRKTTASSIAKEIPDALKRGPEGKPASLFSITEKHVSDLNKRQLVAYDNARKVHLDLEKLYKSESGRYADITKNMWALEKFVDKANAARMDYAFSEANIGKRRITRHSADAFNDDAILYNSRMSMDLKEVDAELAYFKSEVNRWRVRHLRSLKVRW